MTDFFGIKCVASRLEEVDSDLLVVPVCEKDDLSDVSNLAEATNSEVGRARASGEFTGKQYEIYLATVTNPGWRARRLMLVGAGEAESFSTDRLRKLGSTVSIAARKRRVSTVSFLLRNRFLDSFGVQAIAEGLTLGGFTDRRYKTSDNSELALTYEIIVHECSSELESATQRGRLLGKATNLSRELVHDPGNVLTPRILADRAAQATADNGIDVQVLDEREIERLKMGLLLGVSRGSEEPPRIIVLRYEPKNSSTLPVLGLVGKGVTFDSGGISIKPAEGMERMKDDMAGGAAVIGAMQAIGILKPLIRVIGIVPAAENMPSGRAIKPGDILTAANGKRVEIINTDAEGRLLLGDALWYAGQLGATHLVDVATLTGSCIVALGKTVSGLFGTHEPWTEIVRKTAEQAGDCVWPLPLFDEYRDELQSDIADIANSGGRAAGACTAAMFLKEFTGGLPWSHLDIAGTAWCDKSQPYQSKGPTGVAVRTLAELAFTSSYW